MGDSKCYVAGAENAIMIKLIFCQYSCHVEQKTQNIESREIVLIKGGDITHM